MMPKPVDDKRQTRESEELVESDGQLDPFRTLLLFCRVTSIEYITTVRRGQHPSWIEWRTLWSRGKVVCG